jgi:hypothetical protein
MLYAIAAVLLTTVWLVEMFVDGEPLRTILQLLAVAAGFGSIGLWRRLNRVALELENGRRGP